MTERAAELAFECTWILLILMAVAAQILFRGEIKKQAGVITNLLVATPFVLVLGLFYIGHEFGTSRSTSGERMVGMVATVIGVCGYVLSHIYLRYNWSLSAAIREGHELVIRGPYSVVRHPMYSFMMLIVLGSGALAANYLIITSAVIVGIAYYVRAKKEERLLAAEFAGYREYAARTKMFIPKVF